MLNSQQGFLLLVLAVAAERCLELVVARRHERVLRSRGAIEAGASHYPWMVALHTLWLFSGPIEVWLLHRPFRVSLAVAMLFVVGLTQGLRYWVIATLGERWTTRVWVLPGAPLVNQGPFRWMRHPNYWAVGVEIVALPLVHGAWWTALSFGVCNAILLRHRIRIEDGALRGATE